MLKMRTEFKPNDGFIFYSPFGDYRTMSIYKVKPSEKNTIDFFVKEIPSDLREKYARANAESKRDRKTSRCRSHVSH